MAQNVNAIETAAIVQVKFVCTRKRAKKTYRDLNIRVPLPPPFIRSFVHSFFLLLLRCTAPPHSVQFATSPHTPFFIVSLYSTFSPSVFLLVDCSYVNTCMCELVRAQTQAIDYNILALHIWTRAYALRNKFQCLSTHLKHHSFNDTVFFVVVVATAVSLHPIFSSIPNLTFRIDCNLIAVQMKMKFRFVLIDFR